MRNIVLMVITGLGCALVGEHAMAIDMGDLEVTIRVIDSDKDDRGDIGHKLELPNSLRIDRGEKAKDEPHGEKEKGRQHSDADSERHESKKEHDDEAYSSSKEHHEARKEDRNTEREEMEILKEEYNSLKEESRNEHESGEDSDREDFSDRDSKDGD